MLAILLTLIICGALTTGGLFFVLRGFATRTKEGSSNDMDEQEQAVRKLDEEIQAALNYVSPMVPLADAVKREQDIAALRNEMAAESKKLGDLDGQLSKLQTAVEAAEASHNELKKGKEDSESLADEIRARKDDLASEAKRLEGDLVQSRAQLDVLSEEVTLNQQQKSALNSVTSALENASKQLISLNEIYTVASTRFTNLETQYRELEKEFTKLVEKELSGKF